MNVEAGFVNSLLRSHGVFVRHVFRLQVPLHDCRNPDSYGGVVRTQMPLLKAPFVSLGLANVPQTSPTLTRGACRRYAPSRF